MKHEEKIVAVKFNITAYNQLVAHARKSDLTVSQVVRQAVKAVVGEPVPEKPNDDHAIDPITGYTKAELRDMYNKPTPKHQARAYEEAVQIMSDAPKPNVTKPKPDLDKMVKEWDDL